MTVWDGADPRGRVTAHSQCSLQQPQAYGDAGLASRAVPECTEPGHLHQGCGVLGRVGPDQQEGGARSHPCSRGHACGRGHAARNTRTPGEQLPGPPSRLCSRSLPQVSARLAPPWAWATPVPLQPQALLTGQVAHGGPRRPHRRPPSSAPWASQEQSVRKCASTSGADIGPWLAGQAERQEARRTVGQSRPEARGRHQPSRPPH